MKIMIYFFSAFLAFSATASDVKLPDLLLTPAIKEPVFSVEIEQGLKAVENNIDQFRSELEALLGTASHGFAPEFNCIASGKQVEEFLRLKPVAASALLSFDPNRAMQNELTEDSARWIEVLQKPVAADILASTHLWTTKSGRPLIETKASVQADLVFSWLSYQQKSSKIGASCLSYGEALHGLVAASIYHQLSWLPAKLDSSQINHLANVILKAQ